MSQPMRILPEEMLATAAALKSLGRDVSQTRRFLRRQWNRLDSGWEWYARVNANGYFRTAMRDLNRMEQMLEQMAEAIARTAKLIEDADRESVAWFGEQQDDRKEGVTAPEKESLREQVGSFFNSVASGVVSIASDVIEEAEEVIEDVKDTVEDTLDYIRDEGVEQVDEAVLGEINQILPPDIEGEEEFAGYKTDAKVTIPGALVGTPTSIYIEGGADVRLTRDKNGNIIVTIVGMTGGGLNEPIGIAEAEVGLRGRGEFTFAFDPSQKGDMSALLALLATTGGVGLLASGSAVNSLVGSGALTITGTGMMLGGEQVQFLDNMDSVKLEGGLVKSGKIDMGDVKLKASDEFMIGEGLEKDSHTGTLRPTTSVRYSAEAEGELTAVKGGVAVEMEAIGKLNPPGSEVKVSLESECGVEVAELKAKMTKMGIKVNFDVNTSSKIEVTFRTDLPIEKVVDCYNTDTGTLDFSPLKGSSKITVSQITTVDGSLEMEMKATVPTQTIGVEGSSGAYMGREVTLYEGYF